MATLKSIKQYQTNSINNILEASPHTLISIIYQHIIGNLAAAKGAIERGSIEEKGKHINKVIGLIGELTNSLNMEEGGDISTNLVSLYDYSLRKLIEAHSDGNLDTLNEISLIFIDLKSGWDNIPVQQQINSSQQSVAAGI